MSESRPERYIPEAWPVISRPILPEPHSDLNALARLGAGLPARYAFNVGRYGLLVIPRRQLEEIVFRRMDAELIDGRSYEPLSAQSFESVGKAIVGPSRKAMTIKTYLQNWRMVHLDKDASRVRMVLAPPDPHNDTLQKEAQEFYTRLRSYADPDSNIIRPKPSRKPRFDIDITKDPVPRGPDLQHYIDELRQHLATRSSPLIITLGELSITSGPIQGEYRERLSERIVRREDGIRDFLSHHPRGTGAAFRRRGAQGQL